MFCLKVNPGPPDTNYSKDEDIIRNFMDQNIPLVFPGSSQSAPVSSPAPSSSAVVPSVAATNPSGPDGDGSPVDLVGQVRLASGHIQSLVKERAFCEKVVAREIPGLSYKFSEGKVEQGVVEQLLEDAREEQKMIFSLTEKVEQLTGVSQSSRLRKALDTWQEDIREINHATTSNKDISSSINKMIGTIRRIRTLVWTLASSSLSHSTTSN